MRVRRTTALLAFIVEVGAIISLGVLVTTLISDHMHFNSGIANQIITLSSQPSNSSSTTTNPSTSEAAAPQQNISTTQNWAGYMASGASYTGITASWHIPVATGTGTESADATWVGIGGAISNDLIQAGTQNVISGSGNVTTSAFYELLPSGPRTFGNVSVRPGDKVTVTIRELHGSSWAMSFTNNTTGVSQVKFVQYKSSLSSAEWIEEDPSGAQNIIPFDHFGTVSFQNGEVLANGKTETIAGSGAQVMTIISADGQLLTNVFGLNQTGTGFQVSRLAAAYVTSSNQYVPNFFNWSSNWGWGSLSGSAGYK